MEVLGEGKEIEGDHRGQRVNKREFVSKVAARADLSTKTVAVAYEAFVDELLEIVGRGDRLLLTGFGKFYPQLHKGHRVQFAQRESAGSIDDYAVLKFSAARDVNRRLEARPRERP